MENNYNIITLKNSYCVIKEHIVDFWMKKSYKKYDFGDWIGWDKLNFYPEYKKFSFLGFGSKPKYNHYILTDFMDSVKSTDLDYIEKYLDKNNLFLKDGAIYQYPLFFFTDVNNDTHCKRFKTDDELEDFYNGFFATINKKQKLGL